MILKINFQSTVPIYEQLRLQIIEGIGTGKAVAGETLPSVRQLAADLGINLHTVNKTYNLLKDEGYVLVHRKKGVVINPDTAPGITEAFKTKLRGDLYPHIVQAFSRGFSEEDITSLCQSIFKELQHKREE